MNATGGCGVFVNTKNRNRPGVNGRHAVVAQALQVVHVALDIRGVPVGDGALCLGIHGQPAFFWFSPT